MKKTPYLIISLSFIIITFYSCSGGSGRGKIDQSLESSCLSGQTLVDGVCVNIPDTLSLCSEDYPQEEETDIRTIGWGGINVFNMFSTTCYEDAKACEHYKTYHCNSWVDSVDKEPYKLGLGSLGADAYCCGPSNPTCTGAPSDCADGVVYSYKFIKCDGDLYLLHGMIGLMKQASCDNISSQSYNPLKIGEVIALSQKDMSLFLLTPQKGSSLLIQFIAAKNQPVGSPWADVPSISNFMVEQSKDCISSLADDSAVEGAFCMLNSTRYGIDLNLFY